MYSSIWTHYLQACIKELTSKLNNNNGMYWSLRALLASSPDSAAPLEVNFSDEASHLLLTDRLIVVRVVDLAVLSVQFLRRLFGATAAYCKQLCVRAKSDPDAKDLQQQVSQ